jgi:hypothetical protein
VVIEKKIGMATTAISQRTHIWSHVAVIVFHIIMAGMWMLCTYQMRHSVEHKDRWYVTSYVLSGILAIIALLGLVPIVMKRNDTLTITP